MDEEWTDLCTYSTHTQWSALCVLKWHKSFRTYDYSWGPTLCVTLSNIAAHISILTYFRHLSARSIEKAVVTFSMNRAFFRHCSEATFVMAILDSHASELFSEIRWSVHTWAWGIFWEILHVTSTCLIWSDTKRVLAILFYSYWQRKILSHSLVIKLKVRPMRW